MSGIISYPKGTALQDMTLLANGGGLTWTDNIVATATTYQPALTTCLNRVTSVAANGYNVALPPAVGGQRIVVVHAGPANSLQVSVAGGTGDSIDGGPALSLSPGTAARFVSLPGRWYHI